MGPALGGHDDAIADVAVSGDAHLASQNDILADDGRSCQPHLRAQKGMLGNCGSVSNLRQVVDFNATANAGFTDAGAVHAGVRLHLHVAFQHRRA